MNQEEEYEKIWKKIMYGLSVPARRVLMAALTQYLNPYFEQFKKNLPDSKEDFRCGFKMEAYSETFKVDAERAVQEIEQGCTELFDYSMEYTQGGLFELEHRDRLISHYSRAAKEKVYLLTLAPHLASRAIPLLMCLSLLEGKDRVDEQRPPEEKTSSTAEESGEPSPK